MGEPPPLRVLLVDDDVSVLRAYTSALERHQVIVKTASSGAEAVVCVQGETFDVIVSDIAMPRMTGTAFLAALRLHDQDVPVILMTGEPSVESATSAVEHRAFRYLVKPVSGPDLWIAVQHADALHKLDQARQELQRSVGDAVTQSQPRLALGLQFSSAMKRSWIAWQPIVEWRARRVFGYEALLRSDHPSLNTTEHLVDAAHQLGRLHELGASMRAQVAMGAAAAGTARLFVALHSTDLNDEHLHAKEAPLSQIASQVVLEVTERASLHEVSDAETKVAQLKSLGFQIAVDDLGAGYSGLTSFAQLEPEFAKLDSSLIRHIDTDARLQSIVRSMKTLCDELKILVISEGVETTAERDMLVHLGCDLFQGCLFARPARAFSPPRW
jgi:EAL domain-containing protein (putative c-di-GMP-specific phosphodiesterase class I)/ActR/RegA family two-component response regulator